MRLDEASVPGCYRNGMQRTPRTVTGMALLLGLLINGAGAIAQDSAPPKATDLPGHRFGRTTPLDKAEAGICIASYNVLNLFDPMDDPSLDGEYDDLPMATSRDRCESIARAIRAIDADILCLQEVESEAALRWFRDEFLEGMGYDHVASRDVGYYRGVEQSVLSRFPITASTTWPDEDLSDMESRKTGEGWTRDGDLPTRFQRSPLMVDIEVPKKGRRDAYELTVVVVHHKSGRYRRQRESEALQLVSILDERLGKEKDLNLVVLGDYNANPSDKCLGVYKDAGYVNAWEHRWKKGEGTRELFRTHESDRAIDYIMLHPNIDSEVIDETFQVVGTLHPGDKYDWRNDDPPAGYAADHYPLVIDIRPVESRGRGPR